MQIIEITGESTPDQLDNLIELLQLQMEAIGKNHDRDLIKSALFNALKPGSRAHVFVACEHKPHKTVGVGFINVCSGIESGGDYIWINEIHIRKDCRGRGIATALLDHIVSWSEKIGCRNIAGVTLPTNKAARKLCRGSDFNEVEYIWVEKSI